MPNFSVFSEGHQPELTESLSYSAAKELWSAFVQKEPQLRRDIEACPPPNWEQLKEVVKFSWVVNRFCDSIESQPHNPPESHAQPAPDDESSSHTPYESHSGQIQDNETVIESAEAIECSPRSDAQVLFDWGDLGELGELDWAESLDPTVDFMRSYDSL